MQKKSASHFASACRNLGKGALFTSRALLSLVLCIAACSIVTGTLLAVFRSETPTNVTQRSLTFAERVAYQRAIEEVYWRHRIWPKENLNPKPSLDAVMSQAVLEKKVADYLRKSQALEDYWQRPITAEQLQAEIDRMAKVHQTTRGVAGTVCRAWQQSICNCGMSRQTRPSQSITDKLVCLRPKDSRRAKAAR